MNVCSESAAPSKKDLNILEGSSFNTTKFASAYTSPANHTGSSIFVSTILDPNNSQARLLDHMNGAVYTAEKTFKEKEENIKIELS